MKPQFTPGPWKKSDFYVVGSNGKQVVVSDGPSFGSKSTFKDAEANSNLIMAAPELYEALEAALEWIDSVPSETVLPSMPGFDRDWVDGILAKSRGKEVGE